ncbi:MAG: dihydrolipoyl dehydrogenase, partial [Candidatus Bathyarchaeia archaeon]
MGAGPGGYVAAIRLAQLGKQPILVEKDRLGGECLNYGCIPSKALISAAKLFTSLKKASEVGIIAHAIQLDVTKLQDWKNSTILKLSSGVDTLCKSSGVKLLKGEASFLSSNQVQVQTPSSVELIETTNTIVATGTEAIELSGFKFEKRIFSSKEALDLPAIPQKLLIIGGGLIGLELGTLFADLGSKITIVELTGQLLPGTDPELVRVVGRQVEKRGVDVFLNSRAKSVRRGETLTVEVETERGEIQVQCDGVLVAVGKRANTSSLHLEKVGVEVNENGYIMVNDRMRTNVPGIYAIGDITGPPFLAHKASKEGIIAAEAVAGLSTVREFQAMPAVIFTDPEIAYVGLSENEARSRGYEPLVGKFPFVASGRALTMRETEGFVKIIADKSSRVVLGIEMVGADVSNLVSEACLAIELGARFEDLALTVHPHPTLSEGIMEAAEILLG